MSQIELPSPGLRQADTRLLLREIARRLDGDHPRSFLPPPPETLESFVKFAASHFRLHPDRFIARVRPASIALPRIAAMGAARMLGPFTLMEIGKAFGNRDHGTVINACRRIEKSKDLRVMRDSLLIAWAVANEMAAAEQERRAS